MAPVAPPSGRTHVGAEDYESATPPDAQSLTEVKEQAKLNVALAWNVTMPLGKTQDFTSPISLQGFSIEIRYRLGTNYQIGALIGWASLAEKIVASSSEGGVSITGTQLHELSFNPLALRGHYLFGAAPVIGPNGRPAESRLRPFVALGVGATRSLMTVDKGIGSVSSEAWQLALLPEVGALYPLAPADILVGARLGYFAASGALGEQMLAQFFAGVAIE